MAYADPPYLGYSKYYREHPDYAGEVDHAELVARLCSEFPDGWALSLYSNSLHDILPLCPRDARLGAWVKPFCSWKPGVSPAYAWEPVIFRGGRKRGRCVGTARDFCSAPITMQRGLIGVKPEAFCFWLFELLNLQPDDEFVDLFPGSGAVGRAWEKWRTGLFQGERLKATRQAVGLGPLFPEAAS